MCLEIRREMDRLGNAATRAASAPEIYKVVTTSATFPFPCVGSIPRFLIVKNICT